MHHTRRHARIPAGRHARARAVVRGAVALALTAAGLATLTATSVAPAQAAAPATCTVTAPGTTGPIGENSSFTATVNTAGALDPQVLKTLVTVSMATTTGEIRNFEVKLSHAGTSAVLKNDWLGDWAETNAPMLGITFDDAAAASINARSGPGTYQPKQRLSRFDGSSAAGTWTLATPRQVLTSGTGTMNAWTLRVTFDCDVDKDGVADARDNCPRVANSDQANADRDALGNACDPDMDNDSIANGKDNCPTVANRNQADQDRDAIGDACDADRDGDGTAVGDRCPTVAAPTFSGCPEVKRSLKVTYQKKRKAFVGKVIASSAKSSCQSKVRIVLYKGRKQIARVTTRKNGTFVLPRGRTTGVLVVHLPPTYAPKGTPRLACMERWSRDFRVR